MEDIKKELSEYAEIPANVDLENTMRERNGEPIILCVPLDDAIRICQEAVDEAKIEENEYWYKWKEEQEQEKLVPIITKRIITNRIKELKEKL